MDINAANLDSMFLDFNGAFQDGLGNVPNMDFMTVVSEFGSRTLKNFYPWLKKTQRFKEWLGARQFEDVISEKFVVKNKDWEDSIRMSERELNDDLHETYLPIATQMGEAWQELRLELPTNVIVDNFICFDGLPIIDDAHKYGQFTIDNKVATPLSAGAIEAADIAASTFFFENGRPTATQWTQLVVGPALEKRAWDIFKNQLASNDAGGGDSVALENYFSSADHKKPIVVNPYLTANAGANQDVDATFFWYLIDKSRGIGPIGLQTREDVRTMMDTDPARVQRTGNVDYMGDGRLAPLPTFPHLIYGSFAVS